MQPDACRAVRDLLMPFLQGSERFDLAVEPSPELEAVEVWLGHRHQRLSLRLLDFSDGGAGIATRQDLGSLAKKLRESEPEEHSLLWVKNQVLRGEIALLEKIDHVAVSRAYGRAVDRMAGQEGVDARDFSGVFCLTYSRSDILTEEVERELERLASGGRVDD